MGTPTPQDPPRELKKSRRSTGSPRAGLRKATAAAPPATGSGSPAEGPRHHGPRSQGASRMSEQTAPNPGTSLRRRARRRRKAGERSDGERDGIGAPRGPRGRPRRDAGAGCLRRVSAGGLRKACAAARGGEHGHELNSPEPASTRLRPGVGLASPFACAGRRRMGGASAPGASERSRRSRGCFTGDHPPKEGGLCPNYGSSRRKRPSPRGLAR